MALLRAYSACVCLGLLLLWAPCKARGQAALPEEGITDMAFDALLKDLKGNKFFTAATVLGLLARPYLRPRVTLLIPTDTSLAQAATIAPKEYPSLIKFHILQKNFNFKQLRLLPVGTWIPTALPGFGVQVTSNTAANFSIDIARITSPNLCPSLMSNFISCQGISAILNPNSPLSPRPTPNPFIFGSVPPASAPFSTPPSTSPPIFLPPSSAPTSPPSNLPPQSGAPSPSVSSSVPSGLTPSPSPAPSQSVSPLPSPPSPLVLPLTPPPSTPPPSITPLPTVPSPSTSATGTPPPSVTGTPPPFATPPPIVGTNAGDLSPGSAQNAVTSVSKVGATLVTCLGAYIFIVAVSL